MKRAEICIIGSGSAGFSAAKTAQERGADVIIVEKDPALAGQCILRGCMPAKAIFHASDVAHEAKTAHEAGIDVPHVHIDARRILSRERRLVEDFAEDRRKELEQFNVVQGEATFTSKRTLAVNGDEINAERFIVATGSRIVVPPLDGLDDCGFIIPETALARPFSFKSLIVIGAGPVGCEFSQYFARLGVKVTLLQDAPH
ncbi:MAG: FAD-dependent oxidoreductase, partial [Candidatus Eremiobacteraeota bacterium]|nr:FAD-dependent oxidoreductase [Candidatus Eremiobacteraeota bacterium]